ncbi:hypothetical protein Clacol_005336 [Clathrus columnatus]|uniref:2'-phosphotransferase n=1 Tax=Clathrus columnatus TaxID=1419009 RepID=A0AAV5ADW6_9AGAM|nr:hypothetical protein Clacol_005336 [Clathrus columnatus]
MRDEHISRTMTYLLRHKAVQEGLPIRSDGYVRLSVPRLHSVDFLTVERIVKQDKKGRFNLLLEPDNTGAEGMWWIRANQGHSMTVSERTASESSFAETVKNIKIDMIRITDESQVPIAVHGTTSEAWKRIGETLRISLFLESQLIRSPANEGLCRMNRQHVHFAQGIPRSGVLSGMRSTSQVYIFLDIVMALEYGLELLLSSNGVVLTPGDIGGYIHPCFFSKVEWAATKKPIKGWTRPPPPGTLRKPAATIVSVLEKENVVEDDEEDGV